MRIEANDWHHLMHQAPKTVLEYVDDLRRSYPNMSDEAMSRLVLAAAVDFHGATVAVALQGVADAIDRAHRCTAQRHGKLSPAGYGVRRKSPRRATTEPGGVL